MKKNKVLYLIIFIFFLTITFLNPIVGDDWWNYSIGNKSAIYILKETIELYFTWEGRFISRLLINVLTYHKILWNFINSIILTSIVWLINKNIKNKKMYILLATVLIFTLMHPYMFFQTITWVAGNITYMFVIPIIIYYVYLITKKEINNLEYSILITASIIGTMFIENISLVIVFLNILYLVIRYIKNKKIDYKAVVLLILSILSTLLMIMSPGSRQRATMHEVEFNALNLNEKIKNNMPNLIKNTYYTNYYMVFLMIIGNILLIKNKINNKILKKVLYLFELLFILGPLLYVLKGLNVIDNNIFSENKLISILFYSLATIINLILLVIKDKDFLRNRIVIFYCIGILSNLVMLVSPIWGPRTALGTYIFLCISYLSIIGKYIKETKIINYSLILITIISMSFYGIISISVYRQYKENNKTIQEGIKNNSSEIYFKTYPRYILNSINPDDEFHDRVFKEYYGINLDTKIILVPNNWKYLIFYK